MSDDKHSDAFKSSRQSERKIRSNGEEQAVQSNEETRTTVEKEASALLEQFIYERIQGEGIAAGDELMPAESMHSTQPADVARALRTIGDNIEQKYDAEFKDLITHLKSEATGRRSYIAFMLLMKKFIEIVRGSINFPIDLIKVSFQTLVAVWVNPSALEDVAIGDVPDSAKPVVQDLDERAVKTYLKALMNGTETARHIRIMVIGMFGAGKTSLVQNLLSLESTDVESTDGIDIHVNECFISETDEWSFQESNFAEITDYKYRVAALMSKSKTSENSVDSSDNIEIVYQREKVAEKEVKRQPSVSKEDLSKMKKVLGTFKDFDPVLENYWKDIYDAWELTELTTKEGKDEIKSSTQATVSVWDFAGQDVYYSTHHIFMNPASIYLLTLDISIPLASKIAVSGSQTHFTHFHLGTTCLDAFKFWLNSVHTYSAQYGKISPTVILVGTHIDKLEGTAEEKQAKGEKYFDDALKSFINSPVLQHVHFKKFFVDNTNPDEDFNSLRREILDLGRSHRSWNQVVPARWILLERSLEQLKSEGKEMITLEELMENDNENEYPVGNKNELKDFLRFHHSLGNLLYFDTEPLENHIILFPQWIVDAFRCFVTSFPKKDPNELKLWDEYEKQARLSPDLLQSIINSNKCLADYKDEVVKYMEHLDIMAQPTVYIANKDEAVGDFLEAGDEITARKTFLDDQKDKNSNNDGDNEAKKEKLDFHVVPCMLSDRPLEDFMEQIINPNHALKTSVLCYVFSGKFLPPVIFHRLVAVCINRWPLSIREKKFLLYRGLAVFNLTPSIELVIWMNEYVIFCRIVLYTAMDRGIPNDVCVDTRKFIGSTLQELLGIYKDKWSMAVLPFEEHIHCDQVKDPLLGLIPVKDLVSDTEMVCKAHSVVHVVKSEEAVAHWYPESDEGIKPTTINEAEIDLQRIPTEKELNKLSSKIGHEYFRLGLALGIPSKTIQHCEMRHQFEPVLRIFCVLQKWKEANGKYGTLEKLKVAMEAVDCDMDGFYEVFSHNPT